MSNNKQATERKQTIKPDTKPANLQTTSQELKQLSQALAQTRAELKELPQAIAQETSAALAPLQTMQELLPQIAEAFDQVEATQRNSLQQLSEEMVTISTKELLTILQPLKEQLQLLSRHTKELNHLPQQLTAAIAQLQNSGKARSNQRQRPTMPQWRSALIAVAISLISALSVVIGQSAFAPNQSAEELSAQTLKDAQWAQQVWSKADENERALLMQISKRPAT